MNKMMKVIAASVTAIAEFFGVQVSKKEVADELSIWDCGDNFQKSEKRYEYIAEFIEEPVFITVFNLALAQYFYPPIYTILREYTGQGVTPHLAMLLCGSTGISVSAAKNGLKKTKNILKTEREIENFLYNEFYADERLAMYLMGDDALSPLLKDLCRLCAGTSLYEKEKESTDTKLKGLLEELMERQSKAVVQISSKTVSSERRRAESVFRVMGKPFLMTDCGRLIKAGSEKEALYLQEIMRELFFCDNCGICFYLHETESAQEQEINSFFRAWIFPNYDNMKKPLCIITEPSVEIHPYEDISVIKYFATGAGEAASELKGMAERAGATVLQTGAYIQETKELTRVDSHYTLEELKMPERQRRKILRLSDHIKYANRVFEEWNMRQKYPYGKNITVLFTGPPGTGKTMAAGILSAELDMPLYKADLSMIMDKYIGETEKKLNQIFDRCQNSNIILFFDEADVIFGKRSEIKDSKDKFANSAVSFVLQRIEQYEGMIILATNLKNNIDSAFLRRIKHVISFHMPDEKTRVEIWRSGFSKEIPTEEIDMEFLGRHVELAGGYIRNIILNAAFRAAGDNSPVTMRHIIQSVENEYEKLGMLIPPESFGQYRDYLTGSSEGR